MNSSAARSDHQEQRPGAIGLRLAVLALAMLAAVGLTGCATTSSSEGAGGHRVLRIVAAENFWGSIASQLGGSHVSVSSIITNPATDPHSYEPVPADGRVIATADLVIVNGVGYDSWADKLLAASADSQLVLNVGKLVGAKDGDNPHRWYNPNDVKAFITALSGDLQKLDPADAKSFASATSGYLRDGLAEYQQLIAAIKSKYAGTPVGASESIFAMLAPSLGLNLITPPTFLKAISEGSDVSAADKTLIDQQIADKAIKVYVYNEQNTTPDVQALLKACREKGIPTATITETLVPVAATFQQWQSAQLLGIERALHAATGK